MDRERMERFVRDVRFAKAKEFCKNGHLQPLVTRDNNSTQ